MTDDAEALVQQMVKAGDWPEPRLLDHILARGQEAVGPLLEVVRSHPQRRPKLGALPHAITLLGILRPPEAMGPLLELFRHYDDETLEGLPGALRAYGPAVIEPALAVVRDAGLAAYPRSLASSTAVQVAQDHPEFRPTVAAALRELLAEYLARAPDYVKERDLDEDEDWDDEDDFDQEDADSIDDYFEMGEALVEDLAELADPQARDLIKDAFDARVVDEEDMTREEIEERYEAAAGPPEKLDPHAPLEEYRKAYGEREGWESPRLRWGMPVEPVSPPPLFADEPAPEPFRREGHQLGRNDPCWCGSGKKYKKCHLLQDRQ